MLYCGVKKIGSSANLLAKRSVSKPTKKLPLRRVGSRIKKKEKRKKASI